MNTIKRDDITRFVDTDGNLYRVNHTRKTFKKVNGLEWTFLTKEEFDNIDTKKININKYNTLLNQYFKKVKIEWTYNGDKFRALDCIETDEFGIMTNYQFYNNKFKTTKEDLAKLPWFPIDSIYGYGFIAMFRGIVGYVSPYQNGGYQFLDIKTKEFKQWVTLRNLRPIMNLTTKELVGETNVK